jgi:hypothetical protein
MLRSFPTRPDFPDGLAWQSVPPNAHSMNDAVPRAPPLPDRDKREDLRARNKIAAKKWRDKKDETLTDLEAKNDRLRVEALGLRRELLTLKAENHVLEDELKFFQAFMTKIMQPPPQESLAAAVR